MGKKGTRGPWKCAECSRLKRRVTPCEWARGLMVIVGDLCDKCMHRFEEEAKLPSKSLEMVLYVRKIGKPKEMSEDELSLFVRGLRE